MSKAHLLIAAAAAVTSAAALAAVAPPAAGTRTAAPAATGPKATTRAEFMANVQSRFNGMDANHDGMLDANEVSAAQQKEIQQARNVEQQRIGAEFARLDTNKDGQLSKAEFMAVAPPIQARATPQQLIGAVDSNKDGKISTAEYQAGPLATFNKLDSNHDGMVSPQEIAAARAPGK